MSASRHADRNLADIEELHRQIFDLNRELTDSITLARNNGATWDEIGTALHVTKQAAQQRYGR